jgi:excisionase family DNA binding protein
MRRLKVPQSDIEPLAHTIPEVRALLRLGESSIEGLISQGKLKAFWIGRSKRITRASIDALLEEGEPAA